MMHTPVERARIRQGWLAGSLAVMALTAGTTLAQAPYRVVALSGEVAPGSDGALRFASFAPPLINGAEDVTFGAAVENTLGAGGGSGVWLEQGVLRGVAVSGREAPGTPGMRFDSGEPVAIGAGLLVRGSVTAGGPGAFSREGMWLDRPQGVELIALGGQVAPGAKATFAGFWPEASMNADGSVAFMGELAGSGVHDGNRLGIWSRNDAGVALVARTGQEAPGLSGYHFAGIRPPQARSDGGATFIALSAFPLGPNQFLSHWGVWTGSSSGLSLLYGTGWFAPGTASATFDEFEQVTLNRRGEMLVHATLAGPDVWYLTNGQGIWAGPADDVRLVARAGEAAPGAAAGVTFMAFDQPQLNDSGGVAFMAVLYDLDVSRDLGLYVRQGWDEPLTPVAREGDRAPGTAEGVFFSDIRFVPPDDPDDAENFPAFDFIRLNNAGQVALLGRVRGAGVDESNDVGIWATDLEGTLRLVAREGDSMQVEGAARRIAGFELHWATTGAASGGTYFNDEGMLAFLARFEDGGSGIFVASTGVVPEPGALMLGVAGLIGLVWRRRG